MKDDKKYTDEDQKLISKINDAISHLVYDKTTMMKAYNYYHGVRDPEQFRHLEENYGVGTPTSVEFVPLVKKHIDVLIGEYLSTPLTPKVSCKDQNTLSSIFKDRQAAINDSAYRELKNLLQNVVYSVIKGEDAEFQDTDIINQIEATKEATSRNFISEYEIAGQNVVEYILQSKDIDFKNELKLMLTDLLVSGTSYYRSRPSESKTNFEYECLNPIDTFIERNPNCQYLNKSHRVVIRKWMNRTEILIKYGEYLSDGDIDKLDEMDSYNDPGNGHFFRTTGDHSETTMEGGGTGILAGLEVSPNYTENMEQTSVTHPYLRLYPVYEVEWLQADLEGGEYIKNRYEGVRIGSCIFILTGKVDVVRTQHDPREATLSVNGLFNYERNGDPISLVLQTAHLQDKYDMLWFFRDNLIASSGTIGDWVDLAHLPKFLGHDMAERLMKWEGYAKGGKKLYDSSQEGEVINTAFNGFDDTIKAQAIQGIQIAIDEVESACSSITGVFRERLGGIEQRDAVTNVAVGVKNSSMITKPYYHMMDLITRDSLISLMDIAKIVYKNGISGTIILGDRGNKIFTALPEHFTVTDYDIHIADTDKVIKEEELIKEITMEFTKAGLVDADVIIEMAGSDSLTAMKSKALNSLNKKKLENNEAQQLAQQNEQLQQQMQQLQQQAEQLQKELEQVNSQKEQAQQESEQNKNELEWFKAKKESEHKDNMLEQERKRVELEALQLIDDNPYNDKIKNG